MFGRIEDTSIPPVTRLNWSVTGSYTLISRFAETILVIDTFGNPHPLRLLLE